MDGPRVRGLRVGDIYEHPLGTHRHRRRQHLVHVPDDEHEPDSLRRGVRRQTEFKKPLVNSCFTLALVTGQSVIDLTMNGVANLGWDEVQLPNPLFEGDTVYSKSEVLETRESKSRPDGRHRPGEDDRHEPARRRSSSSSRGRSWSGSAGTCPRRKGVTLTECELAAAELGIASEPSSPAGQAHSTMLSIRR